MLLPISFTFGWCTALTPQVANRAIHAKCGSPEFVSGRAEGLAGGSRGDGRLSRLGRAAAPCPLMRLQLSARSKQCHYMSSSANISIRVSSTNMQVFSASLMLSGASDDATSDNVALLSATMSLHIVFQKPAWVLAIDLDVQYGTAIYRRHRRCVYIVVQVQWQNILQSATARSSILCDQPSLGSTP